MGTVFNLQDLKKGDELAWTQAFQTLYQFAYRAALTPRANLGPEEAQDVAIEALAQLVARIQSVVNENQLKALLITIAHRQAISLARQRSALKRPQVAVSLDALPQREGERIVNQQSTNPIYSLSESTELLALLYESLHALDDNTRDLLIAHHVEGSTFQELSTKFGMPMGTVSVKIARGLQKVREALKRSSRLMKDLEQFLR